MDWNWLLLYTWDMSEEEGKTVEAARLGDSVRIENPPMPAIFTDGEWWYFYAFTSADSIPTEIRQEYTYTNHPPEYLYALMCATEKVMGHKIRIIVDPFNEESENIMDKEQIKALCHKT